MNNRAHEKKEKMERISKIEKMTIDQKTGKPLFRP